MKRPNDDDVPDVKVPPIDDPGGTSETHSHDPQGLETRLKDAASDEER